MSGKNIFLLIILSYSLASCSPYNTDDLVGQWQAVQLTEEGDSLAVNLNEIRFQFNADGSYQYESTLKLREYGHFRVDAPFLYTTDTTRTLKTEKAVEISQFENDTMELLMNEAGKERRLVVVRQ